MITLNEHIKESLLDNEDEVMDRYDPRESIKKFIENNYYYGIKLDISDKANKNGKYEVSCYGDVEIENKKLTSLTNGLFEWGEIRGSFDCDDCSSLKSLEGAPKEVKYFFCRHCNSLKSLEGAPRKVNGSFYCTGCSSLKSLEGAPEIVGISFYCNKCSSLKSLKGAPKKISEDFNCSYCSKLTSLEGAPKCRKIISDL